jgi:GNAT superfamily N-acetyltransferase
VRGKAGIRKHRITIGEVSLADGRNSRTLVTLLNAYRAHPMGGRLPAMSTAAEKRLIAGLINHPAASVVFARCGRAVAGAAVCFWGFSTFSAKPLLNVHDVIVAPGWRRQGIGKALMEGVIGKAASLGCCRVTLEVRTDNAVAKYLYRQIGFGPCAAPMEFWMRPIGKDERKDASMSGDGK